MAIQGVTAFGERDPTAAQSLSEFSAAVYAQLSGMQKDIGRILGVVEHMNVNAQRLEKRIDLVETRLSTRIDDVETRLSTRIDDVETRLGTRIDDVETRLGTRIDDAETRLGTRIDDVETRLGTRIEKVEGTLHARIDSVDVRIDHLGAEVRSHKRLILLATGGLGAVAILASGAQMILNVLVRVGLLQFSA